MAGTKPVKSGDHARAAGRRVLGVDGFDRGEGVRLDRARRRRTSTCRSSGPSTVTQQTTTRGLRVLRVPARGTYTVTVIEGTGVGDQEDLDAGADHVGVGRPDRVAAVQLRHGRRRSPSTLPSPATRPAHRRATGMSISVANTGLQPYAQYSFTARRRHVARRRCSRTRAATRCSPATAPTTTRSARTPTATSSTRRRAPVPVERRRRAGRATTTVPLYTVAGHRAEHDARSPVERDRPTAAETTTFAVPVHRGVHDRDRERHRADARARHDRRDRRQHDRAPARALDDHGTCTKPRPVPDGEQGRRR